MDWCELLRPRKEKREVGKGRGEVWLFGFCPEPVWDQFEQRYLSPLLSE